MADTNAPAPATPNPTEANGKRTAAEATKPEAPHPKDPLQVLLERLDGLHLILAEKDSQLAKQIDMLSRQALVPGQTADETFRTRVAYSLQDVEKIQGPLAGLPRALRIEMTARAGTAPGLDNQRLQSLLRQTPALADGRLIGDLRAMAVEVGSGRLQDPTTILSRIEVLENRVRLADHLASAGGNAAARAGSAAPAGGGQSQRPTDPAATAAAATASDHQPQGRTSAPASPAGPRPSDGPTPPSRQNLNQASAPVQPVFVQAPTRGPSALLNIFRTLRQSDAATPPPWEPKPEPLAGRLARFEERQVAKNPDLALRNAELSGQAALEALQDFANAPGAAIVTKIRDAAKADPGGMAAVMAEMREGGRYADLRSEFNNALVQEKAVTGAYVWASAALGRYGDDRVATEAIIAHRPDATALSARFAKLDAEIGQAAFGIPGRRDGQSALDEMAEKAKELVTKAVDAVRSVFGRNASAEVKAGPSPSPI